MDTSTPCTVEVADKTCASCKAAYPVEEFGRGSYCKSCMNARSRAYYAKRKDYFADKYRNWRTSNPDAHRKRNRQWTAANPDKAKTIRKRAYQVNIETIRIGKRLYRKRRPEVKLASDHKRRALKMSVADGTVSAAVVAELMANNPACTYCGQPGSTLDHVVPLARGGRHSIENLTVACVSCNSSKGAKLLEEWAR